MRKVFPQKLKNVYHLCRSVFSAAWFGFPAKKIKVIGVTGTNGKTTTVQMIAEILHEAGHKIAVASTINFRIGDEQWVNKTKFTTLSGWNTQKFIARAVKADCEYLVLEVASHALDQNRVWGIEFDVAAITNVTREHLDYHGTMGAYRKTKETLFHKIKKDGFAVVNLDMEEPEDFLSAAGSVKKYGYSLKAESHEGKDDLKVVMADKLNVEQHESLFVVNDIEFKLRLVGEFNIENALAAICICMSQQVSLDVASKALGEITVVPGRMDHVENDRGVEIVIDYALTPDSMEKLGKYFSEGKGSSGGQLIWVFGSCGERDRGKRPIMGDIVARYADNVIVTNEDPYNEDPQRIIDEVFAGVLEEGKIEGENAHRVFDRKAAIKKALGLAHEGDVVLITGKGAEETMAVGKERIKWNDKRVIEDLLGKLSDE